MVIGPVEMQLLAWLGVVMTTGPVIMSVDMATGPVAVAIETSLVTLGATG